MAEPPRILIAGAYGVFGRLLARELLDTTAAHLVLAGRDGTQAARVCRALGAAGRVEPLAVDLTDRAAVGRAAANCRAVACTAGPFQSLPLDLPAHVVQAGADWLDIADYAGWVLPPLGDGALHAAATAAGRRIMPGLSSVPALSGVLARWCVARRPDLARGHVTLFIGNRNHKGSGAIASALGAGVADPRVVDLPMGRHRAYRFDSPDAALLRAELGLAVDFRVAFEWDLSSRLLAALGPYARRLDAAARRRLATGLAALAAPLSRFGSPLGCVQVDLWDGAGRAHTHAAYVGVGQRLAILPCALAIQALLAGESLPLGVVPPATWLAPDEWIDRLERRGLRFEGEA
jgi:short subunit dehydrogenase-like uncharacterized protein